MCPLLWCAVRGSNPPTFGLKALARPAEPRLKVGIYVVLKRNARWYSVKDSNPRMSVCKTDAFAAWRTEHSGYIWAMKACTKCLVEKPLERFRINRRNKDGRQHWCRDCAAAFESKRYRDEDGTYKARVTAKNREIFKRNAEFIWNYLATHPCACGESDPIVLDFDHRDRSDKRHNISNLRREFRSLKVINDEIAKCDVLCANCHRRRTAQQMGWHKGRLVSAAGLEPA